MEDFGDMGVADDDAGAEDSGGYGGYGVEPGNPASADPDGGNTPGPDYSDSYSGPGPGELGAHEGGYPGASGPSGLASDTNPGEYGGESWAERTLEKLVTQLSGKGRLDALQSFGDWMTGFAKEMGLSVSHEDPGAANPDAGQPDGTTGGGEDDDKGEGGEKEETKDDTDTDLPSDAELEGLKQAFETGTGSTNRARELFEKLAGVTGDQARELYQQVAQVDGTEARGLFRQLSQVDDSQARNLFGQIANMDDSEARGFFRQMASIDDSASRGLFEEATGISRAMWDDWDTMGRPTLQAMSDELRDRSTEAYAERAAGLAAADVNQAFDTETENYRRELARYGIDPRSAGPRRGSASWRSGEPAALPAPRPDPASRRKTGCSATGASSSTRSTVRAACERRQGRACGLGARPRRPRRGPRIPPRRRRTWPRRTGCGKNQPACDFRERTLRP